MTQAKGCEGCSQVHDCKKVYERLGDPEGSSVALKVVIAFALPIGVFVALLGWFDHLLQGLATQQYRTLFAFALALSATVIFMLIVSLIAKKLNKRRW